MSFPASPQPKNARTRKVCSQVASSDFDSGFMSRWIALFNDLTHY